MQERLESSQAQLQEAKRAGAAARQNAATTEAAAEAASTEVLELRKQVLPAGI